MSQVIDIFILDTLENNKIVIESLSTNNGNRYTFPSLSSSSEMPITQAYDHSTTQYWRPSNELKKNITFTLRRRLCAISMRSLLPLLTFTIPTICKMGNPKR